MSEDRNRGSRDYSRYDSMTTEDLEEILRLDAEAPMEQESDTELLLYVMGVLANRRKKNNTGKTAQEAWQSFQQHYLPEDDELNEHTLEAKEPVKSSHPWLRRLIAVAAAIVLVLCIPLTSKAFEWKDIWNVVASWAKETFSFVSSDDAVVNEPESNYREEHSSLQEVLASSGRKSDFIPTWIPDGSVLESIEKEVTPIQEIYTAFYRNEERPFRIRVQSYVDADPEKIEMGNDLIEIYEYSGVEYYLFANIEQIQAVWVVDSYECYISGDLTIEEIKLMIDSIGKG